MKNKILICIKSFFVLFLSVFLVNLSFAASLELQKIGALDTQGNNYPEWWYTGSSPTLSGVAEPGESVTIKINDTTGTVQPDSSGAWSYPTQLENADHTIVISQGDSSISFVLHLGQNLPQNISSTSQTSESTSSVPSTGFNQWVALSFGLGVILLATYFYFASESGGKKIFESRMLKED
jgi:hypothetical protein